MGEAAESSNRTGSGNQRSWQSAPEVDDESVQAATGRSWDQWCDLIDAWPGRSDGHAAIAKFLQESYEIDAWWAQTVTVGYERITGLRQPYQQADGTFGISRSRKVLINSAALREMLLDDTARSEIFPGHLTQLLSKPSAKTIRISIGPGVAGIGMQPVDPETTRVSVEHKRLPDASDVREWQEYWATWLDGLVDDGAGPVAVPDEETPKLTARRVRTTLEQERR